MLIDIHVHMSRVRPLLHRAGGRQRPVPEEIVQMLDAHGIDMAVHMCCLSPETRLQFDTVEDVYENCCRYPKRLLPFCNIDPRMVDNSANSDFLALLQRYKEYGFKGVGEFMPNLPFDDPMVLNVFRQVSELGWPLTFHIGPSLGNCYGCYDELGLPRLERVLKECPGLMFLGHSQPFWAEISADVTDETRLGYPKGPVTPGRVVELMREYPNLYGDLSAESGHNALTRDPEFGYAFLDEFQDRLLFGTDITGLGQELPQVEYFRRLREEKPIPEEAIEKVAWKNADRILALGIAEQARK